MARCEDYPCCGHTDGLPCDWVAPDFSKREVQAQYHIGCDHEAGYCEYDEDDDDEDDDEEDTYALRTDL